MSRYDGLHLVTILIQDSSFELIQISPPEPLPKGTFSGRQLLVAKLKQEHDGRMRYDKPVSVGENMMAIVPCQGKSKDDLLLSALWCQLNRAKIIIISAPERTMLEKISWQSKSEREWIVEWSREKFTFDLDLLEVPVLFMQAKRFKGLTVGKLVTVNITNVSGRFIDGIEQLKELLSTKINEYVTKNACFSLQVFNQLTNIVIPTWEVDLETSIEIVINHLNEDTFPVGFVALNWLYGLSGHVPSSAKVNYFRIIQKFIVRYEWSQTAIMNGAECKSVLLPPLLDYLKENIDNVDERGFDCASVIPVWCFLVFSNLLSASWPAEEWEKIVRKVFETGEFQRFQQSIEALDHHKNASVINYSPVLNFAHTHQFQSFAQLGNFLLLRFTGISDNSVGELINKSVISLLARVKLFDLKDSLKELDKIPARLYTTAKEHFLNQIPKLILAKKIQIIKKWFDHCGLIEDRPNVTEWTNYFKIDYNLETSGITDLKDFLALMSSLINVFQVPILQSNIVDLVHHLCDESLHDFSKLILSVKLQQKINPQGWESIVCKVFEDASRNKAGGFSFLTFVTATKRAQTVVPEIHFYSKPILDCANNYDFQSLQQLSELLTLGFEEVTDDPTIDSIIVRTMTASLKRCSRRLSEMMEIFQQICSLPTKHQQVARKLFSDQIVLKVKASGMSEIKQWLRYMSEHNLELDQPTVHDWTSYFQNNLNLTNSSDMDVLEVMSILIDKFAGKQEWISRECIHLLQKLYRSSETELCKFMLTYKIQGRNHPQRWEAIVNTAFEKGHVASFIGSIRNIKSCFPQQQLNFETILKRANSYDFKSLQQLSELLTLDFEEATYHQIIDSIIVRTMTTCLNRQERSLTEMMKIFQQICSLPRNYQQVASKLFSDRILLKVKSSTISEIEWWLQSMRENGQTVERPTTDDWILFFQTEMKLYLPPNPECLRILNVLELLKEKFSEVAFCQVLILVMQRVKESRSDLDFCILLVSVLSHNLIQQYWNQIAALCLSCSLGKEETNVVRLPIGLDNFQSFCEAALIYENSHPELDFKAAKDVYNYFFQKICFRGVPRYYCFCEISPFKFGSKDAKRLKDHFFQFCFTYFEISSIFKSFDSLWMFLSKLTDPSKSLVIDLVSIACLNNYNGVGSLKNDYLNLNKEIRRVSWNVLEMISNKQEGIKRFSGMFADTTYKFNLANLISTTLRELSKLHQNEDEIKFVKSLYEYFPLTIENLNINCGFLCSEEERKSESCDSLRKKDEVWWSFLGAFKSGEVFSEEKRFYEHFNTTDSANKSILFNHFMAQCKNVIDSKIVESWHEKSSKIKKAIAAVRDKLACLCSEDVRNRVNVENLRQISVTLKDRKPEKELKILCSYFAQENSSIIQTQEALGKVLTFFNLRESLIPFFLGTNDADPTLQKLNYSCALSASSDEQYLKIVSHVRIIDSSEKIASWDVQHCDQFLSDLLKYFGPNIQEHGLLGILNLFNYAAKNNKIWEFFMKRKAKFIDSDGRCFSSFLTAKINDFLQDLSGEDASILQNFNQAGNWVAILISLLPSTFSSLITGLFTSPTILTQLNSAADKNRFSQLDQAEGQMETIAEWFENGLSSLDLVIGQLKCMRQHCIYEFNAEKKQIQVSYYDTKRNSVVIITNDQLSDFQQRLEFVQQEEKAKEQHIPSFLDTMRSYRKTLIALHSLYEKGHPNYLEGKFAVVVGSMGTSATSSKTLMFEDIKCFNNNLKSELEDWKAELHAKMNQHKLMLLFTTGQARRIAQLISSSSKHELLYSISHLLKIEVDQKGIILEVFNRLSQVPFTNWLSRFCALIEELINCRAIKDSLVNVPLSSQEDLMNCTRYICQNDPRSLQLLLFKIFGEVQSLPCQLLWCHTKISNTELIEYLERALAFPHLKFTLIQFDLLTLSQQQVVLKFMLDQENKLKNLHCIECESSILQSATWMPVVKAQEMEGFDHHKWFFKWIAQGGNHIDTNNLKYFSGPAGSGKTFQLKKNMPEATIISISEQFDWSGIANNIQDAFIRSNDRNRPPELAFQINLGKFRADEIFLWNELIQNINILLFHLVILRGIAIPNSNMIFSIPSNSLCQIGFELPDKLGHCELDTSRESHNSYIDREFFLLSKVFSEIDARLQPLELSLEATHVCKYLKALDDGTINSLYTNNKDVVIVLDCSGSMNDSSVNAASENITRIDVCKECLNTKIFPSNIQQDDGVGLILFNNEVLSTSVPLNKWEENRDKVVSAVQNAQAAHSTSMWTALGQGLAQLSTSHKRTKILVALTDGHSFDYEQITCKLVDHDFSTKEFLRNADIHILFITVGMCPADEQLILENCIRSARDHIIPAQGDVTSLTNAWDTVSNLITVSQQIEKRGENITNEDCLALLSKYMKPEWSRQHQKFWIQYMFRRCGILATSEKFNKNKGLPEFGETTMKLMLQEAERGLSSDYQVDWNSIRHEQMIYRKKTVKDRNGHDSDDYDWSILCSQPDSNSLDWKERKEFLKRSKMHVPTEEDLARPDRRVLDSYLAHGLGIPLEDERAELSSSGEPFDFNLGTLPVITEHEFVLTKDFLFKMLDIMECINCKKPCIMMGETGVSKTALSKMLFTLKNGCYTSSRFKTSVQNAIKATGTQKDLNVAILSILQQLTEGWNVNDDQRIQDSSSTIDELSVTIIETVPNIAHELLNELKSDPSLNPLESNEIIQDTVSLNAFFQSIVSNSINAAKLLCWYVKEIILSSRKPKNQYWAFYPVNLDASTTVHEICHIVGIVSKRAEQTVALGNCLKSKIHLETQLCLFFDEINTASCMGILKEIIIDHTIGGKPIPENVVVMAACNPARQKLQAYENRKAEHGLEWASGHYQVHPLPLSLEHLTWNFGSLRPSQEEEFIQKRMQYFLASESLPKEKIVLYGKIIYEAQQITRFLAKEHMDQILHKKYSDLTQDDYEARASSTVSLRDIIRAFSLFKDLLRAKSKYKEISKLYIKGISLEGINLQLLLMSICIVYYIGLGVEFSSPYQNYRRKFNDLLTSAINNFCDNYNRSLEQKKAKGEIAEADMKRYKLDKVKIDLDGILSSAANNLMDRTDVGTGIAKTKGLAENVFVAFICIVFKLALIVIGPPGSSKTLAVTIVQDNARGRYSTNELYKEVPPMISFHYQCSRTSTSGQIQEVFENAIERQSKAEFEGALLLSFVFMDEAGLPEEARESLKILHYYLEGRSMDVGFVAISNHILDAAKSNRCVRLLRTQPNHEELMEIAKGCFGLSDQSNLICGISIKDKDGNPVLLPSQTTKRDQISLLDILCQSYEACMNDALPNFIEMFALRDFMKSASLLGRLAYSNNAIVTSKLVVEALDRNFSGVDVAMHQNIINFFTSKFDVRYAPNFIQNPFTLLLKSLGEQSRSSVPIGRYILVVDTTTNDAILRLLLLCPGIKERFADSKGKLLKLSEFPEDNQAQQTNLISQVRWSAENGNLAILSKSESVNESLYDLLNGHFRRFEDCTGDEIKIVYHSNIAVGAHSRRCRVDLKFQMIAHMTLDELIVTAAPTLNRFEKYFATIQNGLGYFLNDIPFFKKLTIIRKVVGLVFCHSQALVSVIGSHGFYGFSHCQTIESAILKIIFQWKTFQDIIEFISLKVQINTVRENILQDYKMAAGSIPDHGIILTNDFIHSLFFHAGTFHENSQRIAELILSQCLLHAVIEQLMQVVIPENLLARSNYLPHNLTKYVLSNEKYYYDPTATISAQKKLLITRTTAEIIKMQTQKDDDATVSFSKFICESDYELFLKESPVNAKLTIVFDLSQISINQLNFARNKVDEIWKELKERGVNITFLVHTPNADLKVHHKYDTTFFDDWHCSFIDGMNKGEQINWLLIGFSITGLIEEEKAFLSSQMEQWTPEAITAIANTVSLKNIKGFPDKVTAINKLFFELEHNGMSLQNLLYERFLQLWFDHKGPSTLPTQDSLLKKEIQHIVHEFVSSDRNGTMLVYIQEQMKEIFLKFVLHFVHLILQDVTLHFINNPKICTAFAAMIFDGLKRIDPPSLHSLHQNGRAIVFMNSQDSWTDGFPFGRLFSDCIEANAAKVLNHFYYCKDDNVWDQIHTILYGSLQKQGNSDFGVKLFLDHCSDLSEEMMDAYANKYIHTLFPNLLNTSIHFQFVKRFLLKPVSNISEGKILSVHYKGQWFREMLISFVMIIDPISNLTSREENKNAFLQLSERGINPDEQEIHDAIIDLCFKSLLECQSLKDFQNFQNAYGSIALQNNFIKTQCQLKLDAMQLFYLLSSNEDSSVTLVNLVHLLSVLVAQLHESRRCFELESLWVALSTFSKRNYAFPLIIHLWADRFTSSEWSWIYDTLIINNNHNNSLNVEQASLVLDVVVFHGKERSINFREMKSIIDWMKRVQEVSLINEKLNYFQDITFYEPYFMVNSTNVNSRNGRIVAVFFHFVWKWIIQFHGTNSTVELFHLITLCEINHDLDISNLKIVTIAALKLLFLQKIADQIISQKSIFFELENGKVQKFLKYFHPIESWTKEFTRLLISKSSNNLQSVLEQWKQSFPTEHAMLFSWTELILVANNGNDNTDPFEIQPCYICNQLVEDSMIASFSIGRESLYDDVDVVAHWLENRALIGSFWVIPTLIEFYHELSLVLTNTAALSIGKLDEAVVKHWEIGNLIREQIQAEEDGEQEEEKEAEIDENAEEEKEENVNMKFGLKCWKLWTMLKAGVNSYLLASGCNPSDYDSLYFHDDLTVWELVSVIHPTDTHEGRLYTMLRSMIKSYESFFCSTVSSPLVSISGNKPNLAALPIVSGKNRCNIEVQLEEIYGHSTKDILEGNSFHQAEIVEVYQHNQDFLNLLQRLTWLFHTPEAKEFSEFLIKQYVKHLYLIAPSLNINSIPVNYCYFEGKTHKQLSGLSKSKFTLIFHSLEENEIKELLQSLECIRSSYSTDHSEVMSIRQKLEIIYSSNDRESNSADNFMKRVFPLLYQNQKMEQLLFISHPDLLVQDLPQLIGYFYYQLQCESFIFANKNIELKKVWSEEIDESINKFLGEDPRITSTPYLIRDLEACLIKHELLISTHPEESLVHTLSKAYKSKKIFLERFPLLQMLEEAIRSQNKEFTILCGHYVFMRLTLRSWSKFTIPHQSTVSWSWSLKSTIASFPEKMKDLTWLNSSDEFAKVDEEEREEISRVSNSIKSTGNSKGKRNNTFAGKGGPGRGGGGGFGPRPVNLPVLKAIQKQSNAFAAYRPVKQEFLDFLDSLKKSFIPMSMYPVPKWKKGSKIPLPSHKKTHVFLAHAWGDDSEGRNNHERVRRVNQYLTSKGVKTWFDDNNLRTDIRRSMSDGIDNTICMIVFVTSTYEYKVNFGISSNVRFEFEIGSRRLPVGLNKNIIPVVCESDMKDPNRWKGVFGGEIAGEKYIDLSLDEDLIFVEKCEEIYQTIIETLERNRIIEIDSSEEDNPETVEDNSHQEEAEIREPTALELFQCYQNLAQIGDNSDALINLGLCYEKGEGVDVDLIEAFASYRKAAERGNVLGMIHLGRGYYLGIDCEKNVREALELFKQAANQGNLNAYVLIGFCCENELADERTLNDAFEAFSKAADKGHPVGQKYVDKYVKLGIGLQSSK